MGEMHNVRFEPVGIHIEVDEDETVLTAAFRQGVMLMHGCKEGQCSACKSFLLDGDVDLDKYSTFALPDFEEAEGWTLLCRAHPMSDLEVELINYDEEILRSGLPLQTVQTRVTAIEELTSDIRRLVLSLVSPGEFVFHPGQYVDVRVPGSGDEHRSFSMASLPSNVGEVELMIKLYPDGHFSGLLADGSIAKGQELAITGPYGTFTLRESSQRPLLMIGGGAGMAPILSLLRQMELEENDRPATFGEKHHDTILDMTSGFGAEVIVDFVGEGGAIETGVDLLREAGSYFVIGYGENINVPTIDIISREINFVGNLVGSYNDLAELMSLTAQGKVTLHELVCARRGQRRDGRPRQRTAPGARHPHARRNRVAGRLHGQGPALQPRRATAAAGGGRRAGRHGEGDARP